MIVNVEEGNGIVNAKERSKTYKTFSIQTMFLHINKKTS